MDPHEIFWFEKKGDHLIVGKPQYLFNIPWLFTQSLNLLGLIKVMKVLEVIRYFVNGFFCVNDKKLGWERGCDTAPQLALLAAPSQISLKLIMKEGQS